MIRSRLLLVLLLVAATVAHAQPVPPDDPGEQLAALAARLKLSVDQRRALRSALDDAHKVAIQARAQREIEEIDLRRALEDPDADPDQVAARIDRISLLEATMRKAQLVTLVRIRKQLTAAQRQILQTLQQNPQVAVDPLGGPPVVPPRPPDPPPPPPIPGRASTGILFVNALPFAQILLDGKQIGVTPLRAQVLPGKHVLEARWKGFATRRMVVVIKEGETSKIVLSAR